ncbi:response regulator [Longispora albida]|uniref:response regulator n=1 Tax=Longispora albida TaxID=203523 RepID=UPI00037832DA|nr:response regulator [Longispora albida]
MTAKKYSVLLYSDDQLIRERMRLAIGAQPAADVAIEFVEATDQREVFRILDDRDLDLLVLDGEAAPAGGLGVARQVKDDYPDSPPVLLVIARAADRWLAAYANVEATVLHPLDPMETAATVAGLLRKQDITQP